MFNDNGIFEYILQDDIFMGVLGMLECKSASNTELISRRPRVPYPQGVISRFLPPVFKVPPGG